MCVQVCGVERIMRRYPTEMFQLTYDTVWNRIQTTIATSQTGTH